MSSAGLGPMKEQMKNELLAAGVVAAAVADRKCDVARGVGGVVSVPSMVLADFAVGGDFLLIAAYSTSRRVGWTGWIFVGLLAGAELGHDWPDLALNLRVLGTIFLRLIKVIIAPLLFGTLVVGIAGHADLKKVGRLALKSLVYFEVVSTVAMLIGFAAINLSRAGYGVRCRLRRRGKRSTLCRIRRRKSLSTFFLRASRSPWPKGRLLQVVVFSVLFAMALILVPEPKRRPMLEFAGSLSETMFKFTNLVMYVAPIGVFGSVAYTIGHLGLGVLLPLLKLLGTMYAALIFFVVCVLFPIALLARIPIKRFLHAVTEPLTIAFATASSEATLPRAMEEMELFGVPRETVAFVLPTGYSFNMDGAAIYQSLALIFVAQAAGMHLSLGQQAHDAAHVDDQQQRDGGSGAGLRC